MIYIRNILYSIYFEFVEIYLKFNWKVFMGFKGYLEKYEEGSQRLKVIGGYLERNFSRISR